MTIRPAELPDLPALLPLRDALWPGAASGEHRRELENMLTAKTSGPYPCVVLIAEAGEGSIAGFVEVGLRSHADGCDPDHPVGYLEGWFVAAASPRQGGWSKPREMASDTWIDNTGSQRAHEALGYEVVDRCVNYQKRLSAP